MKFPRSPSAAQVAASKARRIALASLSRSIQTARKAGVAPFCQLATVNDCLIHIYEQRSGFSDFRSFVGWKELGFSVKKGESGFAVWGTPRGLHSEDPNDNDHKWFPIAYLFHAGQVADSEGNAPASFNPFTAALVAAKRMPLALPEHSEAGALLAS